ncbi:AAA family ATPase [Nitrincola nitratireducens]|uniref:ATP-dependent zinc metalloprotease FtsH n=1 Tax=Nitrincola nitratireducens TaxID=1229521 RepID=W9VLH5_9GAMM|nr:ATP-binding protein [Nitrincola nitratireducens]EXJ11385.1 ATP-dependent zinc metalloprotease FtsH [Nitrincola nitratireducens]
MHPMLHASKSQTVLIGEQNEELVRQWALRLLIDAQGYRLMFNNRNYFDDDLLVGLGIEVDDTADMTPRRLLRILRSEAKKQSPVPNLPTAFLGSNLKLLGDSLSMSTLEQEILGFLVIKEQDSHLANVVELFHQGRWAGVQRLVTMLSIALRYPRTLISQALNASTPLRQCGLVSPEGLHNGIELLDGLDDLLYFEENGPEALFRQNTLKLEPSELVPSDFEHIQPMYDRIYNYVRRAAAKGLTGVNILIYGEPGTGKTEWVRVLSEAMGLSLYEVKSSGPDGRPLPGDRRLAAFRMAQHMLASDKKSVMLFDEVEDVFNDRISSQYKACVNRVLESNQRPSFWLTNSHHTMDPAYIRRFDLVFEMPELCEKARLKIAKRILKGIQVREEWLVSLSKQKGVHAAHLSQAARVVQNSGYRKPERIEHEIDAILASLYQALGYREHNKLENVRTPYYNPVFSNTDFSLDRLTHGLKRSRLGRICLFGPPGTGKSGYATYLAQELDMLLITRKASDLLDKYLGGTEKALAQAFQDAQQHSGILLIDEADSFLTPRTQAKHSWEVSQVNELLVQMEQYEGILLMSTNYMEHLDSAALRRFDFKVRFNYLTSEQVWMIFNNHLGRSKQHHFSLADVNQCKPQLDKLQQLTPGDFATVERHHRVMGETLTPASLLAGLQREHDIKTSGQNRTIGFV